MKRIELNDLWKNMWYDEKKTKCFINLLLGNADIDISEAFEKWRLLKIKSKYGYGGNMNEK